MDGVNIFLWDILLVFLIYCTFVCFQNIIYSPIPQLLFPVLLQLLSLLSGWSELETTMCRLVLSPSGLLRWSLQKEQFSLIFVKLPGWGIPLKTKARIIGSEGQCPPDRRKHGAAQHRFYVQEIILTSDEKARQLWRGSRDRACQMWQGRSHHAPLYRHKQDAQVCSHCPLPGVQETNERAAWLPTPPGGQVMTSLRPNLFGVSFFFFWFF